MLTVEALLSDASPKFISDWPRKPPKMDQIKSEALCNRRRNLLLKQCSLYTEFDINKFFDSFKHHSPRDKVIAFLNHHAFQFNSKRRFRESTAIQSIVDKSLSTSNTINIVIPIFCVIGNWAKRMDPTTLTFAESCTLQSLQNIADLCKQSVSVDLNFQIIADATFYVRPLGSDPVVSARYLKDISQYINTNELRNLHIHDMCDMATHNLNKFESNYIEIYQRLLADPGYELNQKEHKSWIGAMAATITTRDISAPYKDIVRTFRDNDFTTPFGKKVVRRTEKAFIDYRSLKYAMSTLEWENEYFPNSIRATIHQKDQDVLGLRIYPQYKKLSKFLPYHGVAVVQNNNNTNPQMLIEPEINVISQERVTRYINKYGFSDIYV